MQKALQLFTISVTILICSCAHPAPPNEHSIFIHAVETKDEKILQDYKSGHELNWNPEWKLMDSRTDPHETKTEVDGKIETVSMDTSCILEWNLSFGNKGIIRRETYYNEKDWPSMECFYYENDSIYARGTIEYIMTGRHEKLVITENFSPEYTCTGCSTKSYGDAQVPFFQDTISHLTFNYEYDFYDSTGLLIGAYSCPKFAVWNYKYKNGHRDYTASLTSDTTISSGRKAEFVTLLENE